MFRVDKVEVYDWVGEDVVRLRGDQKGRRAKVLGIKERGGRLVMAIKYYDTDTIAYYCSPFNFALARHWKERKPYKPKPGSVEEVKKLLADEEMIIKVGEERYIPIFYGRINPRLMRCLIEEGFLEKAGRLGAVLKATGLPWEKYREEKARKNLSWFEANVFVYKIVKDIF